MPAVKEDWYPQVRQAVKLYDSRLKRKQLKKQEKREVEAVGRALEWLRNQPDGDARCLIIELYYIRKSHNMDGAAMQAGYSRQHGYNISKIFMQKVAEYLGYL